MKTSSTMPPRVAVIIATCDRERLLMDRCLPSLAAQTHKPDLVLIVDDGQDDEALNSRIEGWGEHHQIAVEVLANNRTPGASGAWNTAIFELGFSRAAPGPWRVAFLDDDDAWLPEHLATVSNAFDSGALWCATGFERITQSKRRTVIPPARVSPEDFHIGNPGIQGSNLAADLELLLRVGGFDEALPACTDRDICIRLSSFANDRYAASSNVTVQHFACEDRQRLSSFGDQRRLAGLAAFESKHGPLMSASALEAFRDRADRYFGYRAAETQIERATRRPHPKYSAQVAEKSPQTPLIVGFIADPSRANEICGLLADITRLSSSPQAGRLEVLILANGWRGAERDRLAGLLQQFRGDGLAIYLLHADELQPVAADRLPIAEARNLLQACLYRLAGKTPDSAVWILDDDMRLEPLTLTPAGLRREACSVFDAISVMKESGIDIGVGQYTGAPPLPFLSTMRLQLLDLTWNLNRLEKMPPGARLDNVVPPSDADFYHDLSALRSDHLETPVPISPAYENETAADALSRILVDPCAVLTGSFPTRRLVMGAHAPRAFHRGGNTLVLDIEALRDTPNLSPVVDGRSTRRADMIWAWQQEASAGRTIAPIELGVFHDRSHMEFDEQTAITSIVDDIRGHIAQRCLRDRANGTTKNVADLIGFYRDARCRQLQSSIERIRGLSEELQIWRQQTSLPADGLRQIDRLIEHLGLLLRPALFDMIQQAVDRLTPEILEKFEAELEENQRRHKEWVDDYHLIDQFLETSRIDNARTRLFAYMGSRATSLEWLGAGDEGVVFTDGRVAYKVFDRLRGDEANETLSSLLALASPAGVSSPLQRIEVLHAHGNQSVIRYPFEPSKPYRGGFGLGLVELMVACHAQQIACRNIHPKNLRVAGERVLLVDYGRDIVSIDDPHASGDEFVRMCRKAYICWRFSWRTDLKALLRASLHDGALPELEGFDRFLQAVRQRAGLEIPFDPLIQCAINLKPDRVLDFGCGKGDQAKHLAASGMEVVGYDPDQALAARYDETGVQFTADLNSALDRGPFDLVICRRVACTLEAPEFTDLLSNLRSAVAPEGRVLFAVCHPVYAPRCETHEARPCSEPAEVHGIWRKKMRSTGTVRTEVFRDERSLKRALQRAGFRVVAKRERETVDLERFEPIADLLVLELEPASVPDVTLMIKACAMEARDIGNLVRHQVRAIEAEDAVAEVILAIDERVEGFPRSYAEPDLRLLIEQSETLAKEGWVDRVVRSSELGSIEALNERWFGQRRGDTHAGNGAQLAATLGGFEACRTRYVLHLDADVMIGKLARPGSTLGEMRRALQFDNCGVTAAFPIAQEEQKAWTSSCHGTAWRVESRAGLVDLVRLKGLRPLPAEKDEPLPAWHRALDGRISPGNAHSLRGSSGPSFFVHPPNTFKRGSEDWALVRDRLECGILSPAQVNNVEWNGSIDGWLMPERYELVIVIIGGRNVPPARMRRCLQSLQSQSFTDWGAIVLDDASDPWIAEELEWLCHQVGERVSVLRRDTRRGLLSNMDLAIRQLCGNSASIIVTLDLDDALIGPDALERVLQEYAAGADLTVGAMFRTDKPAPGPADFANPRQTRGGRVWQHLRTFRKHLWDAIPDDYLKLDGAYVDLANDWAYMLALCELATCPVAIEDALYLHEPSGERSRLTREAREKIIERLCALPPLKRLSTELSLVEHAE